MPKDRPTRFTKISARAMVGAKGNSLIVGFVVGGTGQETLLIRALGPHLTKTGPTKVLAQPTLRILGSTGRVLASNSRWATNLDSSRVASVTAAAGAEELSSNGADSAVVVTLPEGSYSVEVNGEDSTTGVAQAEIYEISHNGTRIRNFSIRSFVGTGDKIMAIEFSVTGWGAEKLLNRADGPSLSQFGVVDPLIHPTLEIGSSQLGVVTNSG